MHQKWYCFYWSIRKWSNFKRFFVYAHLHSISYTPKFCLMKRLIKINFCAKFYQHSICGREVKNFQMFFESMQHPWYGLFLVFFRLLPPQVLFSLAAILIVFNKTNTVLKKSMKILNFKSNRMHPKFTNTNPKILRK